MDPTAQESARRKYDRSRAVCSTIQRQDTIHAVAN
jgi:hypothetical protein